MVKQMNKNYAIASLLFLFLLIYPQFLFGENELYKIDYKVDTLFSFNFKTLLKEDLEKNSIILSNTDAVLAFTGGPILDISDKNEFFVISMVGGSIRNFSSVGVIKWNHLLKNINITTIIGDTLYSFKDTSLFLFNLENHRFQDKITFNLNLKLPIARFISKYLVIYDYLGDRTIKFIYNLENKKMLKIDDKSLKVKTNYGDSSILRLFIGKEKDSFFIQGKRAFRVGESIDFAIFYFYGDKKQSSQCKKYVLYDKINNKYFELENLLKYNPFGQLPQNNEFIFKQNGEIFFLSRENMMKENISVCRLIVIR